ncbi:MAG: response regulator, partial [Magnetococcales bacterium]|nr:response regulator [Magnetococcales bacterium]
MLKSLHGPVEPQELLQSRILMIDDTKINIEIQDDILRHAGFQHLIEFTNSSHAVEKLVHMDPNGIDLVLLDLMMPKMDGFRVLENLRNMQVRTSAWKCYKSSGLKLFFLPFLPIF